MEYKKCNVKKFAQELEEDIIRWRRILHTCPETQMNVSLTDKVIVNILQEIGFKDSDIRANIGGCGGITAILRGEKSGKVLAIRADIDGLPIVEETGLPFASQNGNAHACGHDGHVAMALGAAKILFARKDELHGTVKFIFQPYEEGGQGAKLLIQDGVMENPKIDAIIALHTGSLFPNFPPGVIGYKPGFFAATSDKLMVTFRGKGVHGSTPHLGVDSILMATYAINQAQCIMSREKKSTTPGVLSVTKIEGGFNHNILPDTCYIEGTIRSQDENCRIYYRTRFEEICKAVAMGMNGTVDVKFTNMPPAIYNDEHLTELLQKSAEIIVGAENVRLIEEAGMFGEDMGDYLQLVPGVYFFHSSIFGNERDYPHHHPKFDINEDTLWIGTGVLAQFALDWGTCS